MSSPIELFPQTLTVDGVCVTTTPLTVDGVLLPNFGIASDSNMDVMDGENVCTESQELTTNFTIDPSVHGEISNVCTSPTTVTSINEEDGLHARLAFNSLNHYEDEVQRPDMPSTSSTMTER